MLGADGKVGVADAGSAVVAILAGAEHDVVPVGSDHRVLGETPLEGPVFLVAEGVVFQADHLVGGVVQLNPVAELPVLVGEPREGVRHHFVDDNGAVGDGGGHPVAFGPRLGVFIPGADVGDLGPGAVGQQRPGGIAGHDGGGHLVDGVGAGVEQIHRLSHGGQLELGVEGLARLRLVGVVTVDHRALPGLQGYVGEQEANGVAPVGQAHTGQADVPVGAVPHFHPVGVFALVVGDAALVGGHQLADAQAVIGVGERAHLGGAILGAHGVHSVGNRFPGADQYQQHQGRRAGGQCHNGPGPGLFLFPGRRHAPPLCGLSAGCRRYLRHPGSSFTHGAARPRRVANPITSWGYNP